VVLPQVINRIPVLHPWRYNSQLLGQCDSDERKDAGMRHSFPDHGFATESPLWIATSNSGRFAMNQAHSLSFSFRRPTRIVTRP